MLTPACPLCTDYPLAKACERIHEPCKAILRDDAPERIFVPGTSSGGNPAPGMVHTSMTGIGIYRCGPSHGCLPGNLRRHRGRVARMVELDKQDAVIPAQVMKTAEESMRHGGSSVPGCMIWLRRGDFTHCPGGTSSPVGTQQACAPSFEAGRKPARMTG